MTQKSFPFITSTELGRKFGMSAIKINQKLVAIGFRNQDGTATDSAVKAQIGTNVTKKQPKVTFGMWHRKLAVRELEKSGMVQLSSSQQTADRLARDFKEMFFVEPELEGSKMQVLCEDDAISTIRDELQRLKPNDRSEVSKLLAPKIRKLGIDRLADEIEQHIQVSP